MSNRRDNQFTWNPHNRATVLDCNFVVDSTHAGGIRLLDQGGRIANVSMQNVVVPPGSPNLGTARSYSILAASAVTNTGSTFVVGNLGLSPGTSVTGFPPGTISGREDIDNAAVATAQAQALAAYNALVALPPGTVESDLTGLTLAPGTYTSASSMTLAPSGNGTLTLDAGGNPNAIWVFQIGSTLTVGAGGISTVALINGAQASNVYWQVGSSATLNVTSGSSSFSGNVLAHTSITVTAGGAVNGSLIALGIGSGGAVTISAAASIFAQSFAAVSGSPAAGVIVVQLQDNYNDFLGTYPTLVAPLSGTTITSGLVVGAPYVIVSLGASTAAQWKTAGVPANITPAVGVAFIATATSIAGGGAVQAPAAHGSGIDHVEVLGDVDTQNSNGAYVTGASNGMQLIYLCYSQGALTAPADGTVIGLNIYLNNSAQGV